MRQGYTFMKVDFYTFVFNVSFDCTFWVCFVIAMVQIRD